MITPINKWWVELRKELASECFFSPRSRRKLKKLVVSSNHHFFLLCKSSHCSIKFIRVSARKIRTWLFFFFFFNLPHSFFVFFRVETDTIFFCLLIYLTIFSLFHFIVTISSSSSFVETIRRSFESSKRFCPILIILW